MKKITVLLGMILVLLGLMVFPSYGQVINGCYQTRTGQLRIVNDLAECRSSETPISWNIIGPQGPAGAIDLSKIYISECAPLYGAAGSCQCGDQDDIALSASVACDVGYVLEYVRRANPTDSDPTLPLRMWQALCADTDGGDAPAPPVFSVTCLRP